VNKGDNMNIEDMDVFRLSHQLTLEIYNITRSFPPEEKYGLVSQMRKSAYSVSMNLVEGSHRNNRKEYRYFVGIAKGSIAELKYHLLLSRDLAYINSETYNELIEITHRILQMLEKLNTSLKR
jgi:four helix bundle protein